MYSVDEAIFLQHIHFWYLHNKSNNKNFYDNRYWTYNSVSAFSEQFIYLSEKQIRNILTKLEAKGLIVTGNYNKIGYDRTKWYSLTEKSLEILKNLGIHKEQEVKSKSNLKKENTNLQNGNFDLPKRENGFTQKGEAIPYLNTDLKQITIIKNKNSEITDVISQQHHKLNEVFPDIFDLSIVYEFNSDYEKDNADDLNNFLKSNDMNKLKKLYLDVRRENQLEKKSYKNVLEYHKNNLKINCLSSIWLYDYEILKLRLKYNKDYLLKTIYAVDVWLQDPTNFSKRIDHFTLIENWIKKDIGRLLEMESHIQINRYKFLNYGVDYDLFK